MGIAVANADRVQHLAAADILTPPPPVDYNRFAIDNIVFGDGDPFPGSYNPDLFPFFTEIFRACSPDDPCRIVTIAKSAQVGGTILATIFTGGSMVMDPCHLLYVHPTEENGRRWSKMKLAPLLRSTTALKNIFRGRPREAADAVMYKETADGRGVIQISGANSPASLSQVTMRRQVQDDLSKWEPNSAGDPEGQADTRSFAHEFAKILKISTPLVVPGCKITRNFRAGSQERYHVPCPHCQHMQVLEWGNMLANLDEQHPERAHFTCTGCGCEIQEHQRPAMIRAGAWVAENPKAMREHRSFWIWSAYSLLQSWERIARAWIKAKGFPAAEQVFLNDVAGLAYEAAGEAPPWEELRDRAAQSGMVRGRIPQGGLVVTLGIDCQGDRVEWQAVAWGRDRRRWHVDYGVIPGHISEKLAQDKLAALLKQEWPNAVGRRIGIDLAAIDGNAYTEDVWEFVRHHPASRIIMVRGGNQDHAPLFARVRKERDRKGNIKRYSKRFYTFNGSNLKMNLYRSLAKTDPQDRGFVGLPDGLDDEYFRELCAEKRVEKKDTKGYSVWIWTKDPTQDNEALDTALQAEAAALKLGLRSLPDAIWDRYEAEREAPLPPVQGDIEDLALFAGLPVAHRPLAEQVLTALGAMVAPPEPSAKTAPAESKAERMARLAQRLNG